MSWINNPCCGNELRITFMRTVLLNVETNANANANANGRGLVLSGYEKRLLDVLAFTLNFTYSLERHPDGHYGSLLKNQTWTGAVGKLERDEADVALSKLTVTYPRRAVIDFSIPYFVEPHHFYIGNEITTKSRPFILSPFDNEVWFFSFLCLMSCVIFSRLFSTGVRKDNLFYLFDVISITFNQGDSFRDKNRRQLAVITVWLFSCLFIRLHFGNELRASTSVYSNDDVKTLDQLSLLFQKGQLSLVIPPHNSFVEFINNMPASSRHGDVYRRARVIRPYDDRVYLETRRGMSAMILGRMTSILKAREKKDFKLSAVQEPLTTLNIALGLNKNLSCSNHFNRVYKTPFRAIIKYGRYGLRFEASLRVLWESGCLEQWEEDLTKDSVLKESGEAKDSVRYITLPDLASTFVILLTICFLSIVIRFYQLRNQIKRLPRKRITQNTNKNYVIKLTTVKEIKVVPKTNLVLDH